MLRKLFDVFLLKEMNSGKFLNIKKGFVKKMEEGTNFVLISPLLPFFCFLTNWYNKKYYFIIKRVCMPVVKIDATITPDLMKKYFNKDKE